MAALGAAEYTELVTSTLAKIESGLVDQVLTKHPTLDLFRQYAKSETGRSLVINVEAAEDTSTQFTDASGTFSTAVSGDILGAVEYLWGSPLVSSVRIKWKDLQKNSGKEQILDLLKVHIEAAKKAHAKKIVQQLHVTYKAGLPANVGTETGPFHSFDGIISDAAYDANPTGAGAGSETPFAIGGVGAPTPSWWEATRMEVAVDSNISIRKAFRKVRNELAVNTSNDADVTHIIAGRDVFEEFEDSFDDKVRYNSFGDGQTRFRSIMDGDIEVRLDPDAPAKRAYFVDINTWRFGYLNGNFMKAQPSQTIQGNFDFVVPLASLITVGTSQRRNNAVLLRPATAGGAA